MDWIERWLHVSPDGGDGSLELMLILLAVTGLVTVMLVFSRRSRSWFRPLRAAIAPGAPKVG
jgi:hypothetical protein